MKKLAKLFTLSSLALSLSFGGCKGGKEDSNTQSTTSFANIKESGNFKLVSEGEPNNYSFISCRMKKTVSMLRDHGFPCNESKLKIHGFVINNSEVIEEADKDKIFAVKFRTNLTSQGFYEASYSKDKKFNQDDIYQLYKDSSFKIDTNKLTLQWNNKRSCDKFNEAWLFTKEGELNLLNEENAKCYSFENKQHAHIFSTLSGAELQEFSQLEEGTIEAIPVPETETNYCGPAGSPEEDDVVQITPNFGIKRCVEKLSPERGGE